ncbi:hypothetical protein Q3G72_008532 [Acer saccharum]|nr:hypothetical protein Q3G72_008532 [Acer saccharum]
MSQTNIAVPLGASFVLNLVDIGLSYEPYFMNSMVHSEDLDSLSGSTEFNEEIGEQCVACLLAASSLTLTSTTVANSMDKDYKIRVKDLDLFLCTVSKHEKFGGPYNACHDTTSGLVCLATHLQQLFAPDTEESIVYLQNRYNNAQQAHERNDFIDESRMLNTDLLPSTSKIHSLTQMQRVNLRWMPTHVLLGQFSVKELTRVKEALAIADSKWFHAMEDKYQALMNNSTWKLVELPTNG